MGLLAAVASGDTASRRNAIVSMHATSSGTVARRGPCAVPQTTPTASTPPANRAAGPVLTGGVRLSAGTRAWVVQAPRGKVPSFVSQSVSATKRIRIEFCLRAPSNTTARLVALQPGGISLQLRWGHVALAVARPGNLRQATRHAAVTGRRSDVELAVDGAGRRVELYVGGVEQAAFAGNAVAPRLLEIGRLTSSPTSAITLSGLTVATSAGQLIPARAPAGAARIVRPGDVRASRLRGGGHKHAAAGAGTASSGGTAGTDSAGGDGTSSARSAGGDGDLTNPALPGNPFSPTSFWNAALAATAPLDPNSHAYVNELVRQVKAYGPWMNTTSYSVPVYVVGADQPTVHVTLDSWGPDLQAAFDAVPIPDNAKPAAGSDEHMVVWQPTTDKMWEFFEMHRESDGWHASWGGEMDDVSTDPGYFTHDGQSTNWGATATGLPLLGGLVTAADLERGYINHALAISLVETDKAYWSWPAQRTDGDYWTSGTTPIPEGTRFRLNPNIDVASLNLPPLDRMLAQAAQTYGIVVRDKAGAVTFYGQDPVNLPQQPMAHSVRQRVSQSGARAVPLERSPGPAGLAVLLLAAVVAATRLGSDERDYIARE